MGAVSTAAALALGVVLGAIAGYAGGWVDDVIMRFTEFFQTVPSFILAVVLVAIFTPSITSIVASHRHRLVAARHPRGARRVHDAAHP